MGDGNASLYPAQPAMPGASDVADAKIARRDTLLFALLLVFLAILAAGGGSSRADVPMLVVVRSAALFFLLYLLLGQSGRILDDSRKALIFVAAVYLVFIVQLIPLPPSIWTQLPGRDLFARSAEVAGIAQPWRPLSIAPEAGMNSLLALLCPTAALFGTLALGAPHRERLLFILLGLALFSGLLGTLQLAAGPDSALRFYPITNKDSGVGLLANRNHQAALVAASFPILCYAAFVLRRRGFALASLLALVAGLFMLTSIWVSGSRMGLVLMLIATPVSLLALNGRGVRPKHVLLSLLAIGAIAAFLFTMGLTRDNSFSRFAELSLSEELRIVLLPDFAALMSQYFPFGAGFGTFPQTYFAVERLEMMSPFYLNHAHNDLIEIVIEGGLFGILLLLVFLAWWVATGFRFFRGDSALQPVALGRVATIATFILLLASIADYPLRTPLLGSIFACLCAIMIRSAASVTMEQEQQSRRWREAATQFQPVSERLV